MSRNERNTILESYLKERNTNYKDNEAVLDFIETEIEINKNASDI